MKDDKKKTENVEVEEEVDVVEEEVDVVEEEVDVVEEELRDENLEDATGGTFTVLGPGEKMWDPSMGKWRW